MFLKNVNFLKRLSIANRLSVLYACTSFIMLLMISLYSYLALTDTLTNGNEKFLSDEFRVIRNILLKHPDKLNMLAEEVEWVPEELEASEYRYYAKISDRNKKIYAITERMSSIFKNVEFPEPTNINEQPDNSVEWVSPSGNKYLLISALAKVGSDNSVRLVEIALDISSQQQIIAKYRTNLFIVLFLGIIFAVLLGIWVANKGMRAVNDITKYAEHASVLQFNAIKIDDCPKELQALVCAINNMLMRIENAFKKLALFSNELAHELRTPINNLMGEAEIILSKERSVNEYKEVIASSLEEYLRISKMIENILFLARTEQPNLKLRYQKINLHTEFQNIAEAFEPLLNEKNILLNFYSDLELFAEPNLLRRTLNNLISNAIRYTPQNGFISLTTQRNEQGITIMVTDNGIGIAKEHLPYVFDRFYRVKHEEFDSGLGFGLAIVKSIMELHKGYAVIKSTINTNTIVSLIFPQGHA